MSLFTSSFILIALRPSRAVDPEMARVLISAGSNKDCKNYDGNTPLHCAAAEGFDEVARLLLVVRNNLHHRNSVNEYISQRNSASE